jgi:hypothetical protein
MSVLHMRHIQTTLEKLFKSKIDLSDVQARSPQDQEDYFLTRSLAAYSLMVLNGVDESAAAKCVTDGFGDNGIDLIHHDRANKVFYIVQAKWIKSGEGSLEVGDIHKFIAGVKDLVNGEFDRFNAKIQSRKDEVLDALDDSETKIALLVSYTGRQQLSTQAKRCLSDLLDELNDTSEMVSLETISQGDLHQAVAGQVSGIPIDLEVGLHNWGTVTDPYQAFYGQVSADLVAEWWNKHRNRLFTENLRNYRGTTEVNDAIQKTLETEPEHFQYFNNGLTALCNSVQKKMLGGTGREFGVFDCKGVSIVNGAQTVGSIAAVYNRLPEKVKKARIMLKLLSLETCPQGFGRQVTIATNTQNKVERVDFVALDPEQQRLKTELFFDGKEYVYKSGDPAPKPAEKGCAVTEAVVALACAHEDIALAVQAKREVGKLWENIDKAPYKQIFNPSVTGIRVWRAVEIMRAVDACLAQGHVKSNGKTRLVAVHGNRFILHKVFRSIPSGTLDNAKLDFIATVAGVGSAVSRILDTLVTAVAEKYASSYPASLFKNLTKCKDLANVVQV